MKPIMGQQSQQQALNLDYGLEIKIDAKSIGENDSALKSGMDVYKAPPVANSDKDNMDLPLEIRKITVESDYTSPMGVRVVKDNIVINGGGLDRDITVRSTALSSDVGGEQQVKMTFLDGILKGLDPVAGGDGYGMNLNLVVRQRFYDLVTIDTSYLGGSNFTNIMQYDSGISETTATYYWRNGLYVGTVNRVAPAATGPVTTVNVDNWCDQAC